MQLSMPFISAVAYATDAHQGQVRKGTNIPYISHPIAVASLVLEFGGDEDQAIAGLLHDVIEDCDPVYAEKIQETFGARVYSIVRAMTDGVAGEDGQKPEWRQRKEAHIAHLANCRPDILLVAACDKIHNARCLLADIRRDGLAAFSKFRGGIDGTLWYLGRMSSITACTAAGPALRELVDDIVSAAWLAGACDSEGGEA